MIPTSTANAALSLVSTLVRLTGRIDRIVAEQAALREDLAFAGKVVTLPPPAIQMVRQLKAFLDATAREVPDPLSGRRSELEALVEQPAPAEDALVEWMETLLPEKLVFTIESPAQDFAAKLAAKRAAWNLSDDEVRRLVYYLAPGEDVRQAKLPWQLAMSVVDALTEVAVANPSLLLREDRARPLIRAVLERFADADLATAAPNATLRLVLKATLNGALDSAGALSSDKAGVNAVLSALANARAQFGDDLVVGLARGRGYALLVGHLLEQAGGLLRAEEASDFERIAADVVGRAGTLIQSRPGLEAFLQDHWGDLLRAGLRSVQVHGNAILGADAPLLRATLLASIDVLADDEASALLGNGTLVKAVEAAVAAVAVEPDLLNDATDRQWLRRLIGTTAALAADRGIRAAFSSEGLHSMLDAALSDLAAHPELIVEDPGLPQEALGGILRALASSKTRRLDAVAADGARAVIGALAENPALARSDYPAAVARMASALADALDDRALSRDEARQLLGAAAESVAANPAIVGIEQGKLAGDVLAAALVTLGETRGGLVAAADLQRLATAALDVAIAHPGLFAGEPMLAANALEAVLSAVRDELAGSSPAGGLTVSSVAAAAAGAVLAQLAADPGLLETRYPGAVGRVAALLARLLADGKITGAEADDIVRVAAASIAANATLLAEQQGDLAREALAAVLDATLADRAIRLRGPDIAAVAGAVLAVLAAHGKALLGEDPVAALRQRIAVVIEAGLIEAARQLGVLLDRREVSIVLASLVRRWALDRVPTVDPDDPRFARLFAEAAAEVLARVA
jgi:hypothetical protein